MKLLILPLVIALVHLSKQDVQPNDEMTALIGQCVAEAQIDSEMAKRFMESKEMSDDPQFKCFLKCIGVNTEIMDGKEIDFDLLEEIMVEAGLPREKANKITKACEKVTGSDECDLAYQLATCMINFAIHEKYV